MLRSWIVRVAVVVLVVAGGAAPANASTCSTWEWINPLPQGNLLSDVAYGNGTFVAVGGAGIVLTTPNGTDPVVGDLGLGSAGWVNGLTWTGAQFIAVGSSVLTSPDGFTWTEQASGTSLTDVIWAGGQAVAVGSGGLIQTSPDLFTWTTQVSGTTRPLSACAYGAGLYVIVGHSDNTESVILTSPDGITWTRRTSGTRNALEGVVWNGTRFVAVGQHAYSSDPWILSSADGITWAPETTSATGTFRDVSGPAPSSWHSVRTS